MAVPADPDDPYPTAREHRCAIYEVTNETETLWVLLDMKNSGDLKHWLVKAIGPAELERLEGAPENFPHLFVRMRTGRQRECWREAQFELDLHLERDGWRRTGTNRGARYEREDLG